MLGFRHYRSQCWHSGIIAPSSPVLEEHHICSCLLVSTVVYHLTCTVTIFLYSRFGNNVWRFIHPFIYGLFNASGSSDSGVGIPLLRLITSAGQERLTLTRVRPCSTKIKEWSCLKYVLKSKAVQRKSYDDQWWIMNTKSKYMLLRNPLVCINSVFSLGRAILSYFWKSDPVKVNKNRIH